MSVSSPHIEYLLAGKCETTCLSRGSGRGGQGALKFPVGGPCFPNKIGAMTTECVLLLLHALALDAFRNTLLPSVQIAAIVAPPFSAYECSVENLRNAHVRSRHI